MSEPTWRQGPPRKILLATDLSSRCDRALDRVAQLAGMWGCPVVALHVLDTAPDVLTERRLEDLPSWRRPPDRGLAIAAQIRRDLGADLPALEVRVEDGPVAEAIDAVASETGADLIVTGVARNETFGRFFLGATVERLVRRTRVPVLVVQNRVRPYGEILVATDFSDSSRHALDAASAFFPQSPLTLLHAYETPFALHLDSDDFGNQIRGMEQKASDAFVAGSSLSPEQRRRLRVLVEHGRPEALIGAYMRDRPVDLVVLGSHGRSAVFEALIGSTAKRILEVAPGDVLLVRDPRSVR
ncbi:universal stress protein [Phenylobacterium sp.]|uniref:universal stress protein n=1 Tax=Phenylobacterium sp. TaxID=1871053 RepID=UPI00301BED4D